MALPEGVRVPAIDYTSRDFESIISDLIEKIPFYTPEWTDTTPTDPGVVILELFAMMADSLHFQVDRALNESYLLTATSRRSVVNLLKLIDFELTSAAAATGDVKFTLSAAQVTATLIPKGFQVQTRGGTPVVFETVVDLVIPAGNVSGTVGVIQGETVSANIGVSDGRPFQKFTLAASPIIDGTLRIFVNEGAGEVLWTELDSLALAGATDKVYNIQKDDEGIVTVFFGDDGQGKIPEPSATLRAEARIGGGEVGNVGPGEISVPKSSPPVALAVTNALKTSGGEDEMSVADAKVLGPRSLRTLDRAVTEDDFKTLALTIGGVAKVRAFAEPVLRIVNVFVAPSTGGVPSSVLKDAVKDFLEERKMAGTILQVEDPEYPFIDCVAQINVKDNFVQSEVRARTEDEVDNFLSFDNAANDFGRPIHFSDFAALIDNLDGIDFVDFTKFTLRPVVKLVTWSGNATFSEVVVSETTKRETWTVTFTSPTAFSVSGSVSGLQLATGVLGVEYASDTAQVKFKITAGANPMAVNDKATIRTHKLVDNLILEPQEIAQVGNFLLTFVGGA